MSFLDQSIPRRAVLKRAIAASTVAQLPTMARSAADSPTDRPHIVFILADDLGWGDLSCYGQTDYSTPMLDQLASQGQRFMQGYSNSAVCSATRTALITGRYQYRYRVGLEEPLSGRNTPYGLPADTPTLPGQLQAAGYRTVLVGKWHLGYPPGYGPLKSGYESFYGNLGSGVDYFTHHDGVPPKGERDFWDGNSPVNTHGYYTDLLSDRAVQEVMKCQGDPRPLFLSLHYTAPHWPWEGPQDEATSAKIKSLSHIDGGSLAIYGRMVQAMDNGIGKVLAALRQIGAERNTIVVFTSDNGGERFSRTWPFSGQKTELLEGGIRVPLIVRWPAQLGAGVCDQVAISMDLSPTLLAAAGAQPIPSDGIDLLPMMQEGVVKSRKLYWRYKSHGQQALRDGDYKYLFIKKNEFLFDLKADQRERANLAKVQPERLAAMRADWAQWNEQMLPIPAGAFTHAVSGKIQADRYGVDSID